MSRTGACTRGVLTVAGLATMSGCILYTDAINSPPTLAITGPKTVNKGMQAEFRADARDPDGGALSILWWTADEDCPPPPVPQNLQPTRGAGPTFRLPAITRKTCVYAAVVDHLGAFQVTAAELGVTNQKPIAEIDVQQPAPNARQWYPLYADFRVTAAHSMDPDGDMLTRKWTLSTFPAASKAALADCSPFAPEDEVQCFVADVPGRYAVTLVVNDGEEDSDAVTLPVDVEEDAPPCVIGTSPDYTTSVIVLDPAVDNRFDVLRVADDGDPFPAGAHGAASFAWSIKRGSEAFAPISGYTLPHLTLPANSHTVGERVVLRLLARDRKADLPERALRCADDESCGVKAGCNQRVVFNLEFR